MHGAHCGGAQQADQSSLQAHPAGGRLGVAHLALCGAELQGVRRSPGAVHVKHRGDRSHFNGVSQRGARAVHLQSAHLAGAQAGVLQRQAHHLLLAGAVGRGERAGPPVLVDCTAQNHSYWVCVSLPAVHAEPQGHAGLAPHVAVCRGVQRLAPPVWRQHGGCHQHANGVGL